MDSQQYPQPIMPGNNGGKLQRVFQRHLEQSGEDEEGGLKLGQVVASLRRRILVIVGMTTVVASVAVLRAATSVPIYQSKFEILTKPITVEAQVISSVPQTLAGKEQTATEPTLSETKLKLLKSPKILNPVVTQLKPKYPHINYDQLAAALIVTALPTSDILDVSYQSTDPEEVEAVLNLVSKAYLEYSLQERLADVRKGIEFVEEQLPKLQDRVQAMQGNLQRFRQEFNLVDPESQGKQLSEQMGTFEQQRLETQIKLSEAEALSRDLQAQLAQRAGDEAAAVSALVENPRYQQILGSLLEVDKQIAKDSSLFLETSPDIQVLQTQRQRLLPLLSREGQRVQEQVSAKIRELEARSQALTNTEDLLNQRVKQLSVISRQYVDIQRELQIATENLNQFLTKREALRIDAGQRETPWQILTAAGEPIRSAGNTRQAAILGAILGMLLGVGLALLLDKLRDVLHSPDDAKDAAGLPLLGVIPHNSELQEIEQIALVSNIAGLMQQVRDKLPVPGFTGKPDRYGASPFLEAFRSLYTNIRLLNSDTQIRSLIITSATPGDGKSTTALYLAQAAAALGQRVLLVDTDLRRPKLHERLKLENDLGLSNVISSDLNFEKVLQRSPLEANLTVLTAGLIPPDPTRLLSSQKMQNLMEQFQSSFDLVIYDTPPVLGLADAKLIASKTDGIIMVVGLASTRRSALTQALDAIKLSSVGVLGVVANGSRENSTAFYQNYLKYYSTTDPALLEPDTTFAVKPARGFDYDN